MTGTRNSVERSHLHSSDCNPEFSDWFGIVHKKMPGKVKVKILAGRNLPVMDRSSDTTDAYVEIKLGNTTYKTDVYRKSLNPQWNSDWYKYEVDDSELQDEPLQIRLMDHDTYSANDAIGKVYLDLNPLLLPSPPPTKNTSASEGGTSSANVTGGATMAGWIPVFDTMHGIRGEVNIIVKVELFSDFNKFRQSSCGVQFFCSPVIPHGYHAQVIHGFVEELVVNDDPEYQWIDKIRTPRASNEARQTLFFKLSGEVQRKIGLKALDLGGNAVIGYHQCFDLEGESGIVVRGIGTAVTLIRLNDVLQPSTALEPTVTDDRHVAADDAAQTERTVEVPLSLPSGSKISPSPAKIPVGPGGIYRRSSDSDLSITPKGNSLTGSDRSSNMGCHFRSLRPTVNQDNMEMLEYPFLTMRKYGPGFIQHLGGTISARSVKLLERITNLDEPESRDSWWTELRMEVRSHARAIGCNVVLGYSEHTSICDDVCVLSASGTAAFIQMDAGESSTQHPISRHHLQTKELMTTSLDRTDFEKDKPPSAVPLSTLPKMQCVLESSDGDSVPACSICHIPYSESSVPFRVTMMKCVVCGRGKVPDVLLTTIEPPEGLPTLGKGCFLQAYVCRPKRVLRGELNAKEISDGLPFLEYELHRLLLIKLKLAGMNSIFGLKVEVAIGEKMMIGLATGTAIFLSPLPVPPIPKISCANPWTDEKRLTEIQKNIVETVKKNRDLYQLKNLVEPDMCSNGKVPTSDTEDSDDERPALELSTGNKDTWIFEIDDSEDVDKLSLLIDPRPPEGFHTVNIETVPGLDELEVVRNLQMFTQVWRAKISSHQTHVGGFSQHINRLLQSVYFKLRRLVPCALCNLEFRVELPEIDEVQLSVLELCMEDMYSDRQKEFKNRALHLTKSINTSVNNCSGMAIGLSEPEKMSKIRKRVPVPASRDDFKKLDEGDMIFSLEEDHDVHIVPAPAALTHNHPSRSTMSSIPFYKSSNVSNTGDDTDDLKEKMAHGRERYGVDITPLSYIPGAKIDRYLGNLNFFFIRESTSIREAGGLSGFVHSFVTEVLAILRAHVTALGGNAMVAYFMSECVLYHNPHKNQGQCLINVGGDVVCATYYTEE